MNDRKIKNDETVFIWRGGVPPGYDPNAPDFWRHNYWEVPLPDDDDIGPTLKKFFPSVYGRK